MTSRFMAFDEFLTLMTAAQFINDEFTEREAILAFAQSMMTQVDELDNDRHMKMQLTEYFEALARSAEVLSLPPPDSNVRHDEEPEIAGRLGDRGTGRAVAGGEAR